MTPLLHRQQLLANAEDSFARLSNSLKEALSVFENDCLFPCTQAHLHSATTEGKTLLEIVRKLTVDIGK